MNASEEALPSQSTTHEDPGQKPRSVFRSPEVAVALIIVAVLTALVPYSLSFDVHGYTYVNGEYTASQDDDARGEERATLIGVGLALPVVCLASLIVSLARKRVAGRRVLLSSALLYTFVLGWTCYPYWGYGVHRATRSLVAQSGLDPSGFLPDAWLGGLWQIPAILLRWLAFPAILVLLAVVAFKGRRPRAWICDSVTVLLSVLTFLALAFTPLCLLWLLD